VRGMALILSLIGYYYFEYSNKILGFAFLFVLFLMIVLGAGIFGILASKVSQYLSEMGYSLYLLQGPFIYLFWKILGFEFVSNLNEWQYVALIFLVAPIYVLMCDWSYKFIEAKFKSENIYKIFQIGRGKSNEYRD
jgi:peptidoglycan/LPS O-acetylase OafA/YrhL